MTARKEGREGTIEQIAQIRDHITVPDCVTTGTVKDIKEGSREADGQDAMLVYEMETTQARCALQLIGSRGCRRSEI